MQTLKRATIKEELVALTGDLERALILNQFLYWSERIKDFDKFLMEEKTIADNVESSEDIELLNGWIFKDMEQLKDEIMLTSSVSTLSRKTNFLVEKGWLDKRRNPKFKWDKTYQYRVNLIKISTDLMKIGYTLQGYKIDLQMLINANLQNDDSNLHNEKSNLHGDGAIPEITTETTSENTTETTTTTEEEKESHSSSPETLKNKLEIDENFKTIVQAYQQEGFGSMTTITAQLIDELLEEYSKEWILEAMKVAVESNKRTLKYVKGVLRNWKADGGMKIGGGANGNSANRGNGSTGQGSTGHYEKLDLSHIGYKGDSEDKYIDDDDLI